jgi:AcrR family transcriptional regulator
MRGILKGVGKALKSKQKSKGESTREFIIDTAISLLARKGYEATSFQEIADLCHLSQAAPLYHFKSKEGLFLAAVEHIRKNKARVISEGIQIRDDAFIRLLKYFRGHINWAEVYRFQAGVFLLLGHFASFNQNFAEIYQSIVKGEREEIEILIAAGEREKIFHFAESTSILAELLHDAILGITTNLLAGRGEINSPRRLEKKSKLILQAVLGYEIESE